MTIRLGNLRTFTTLGDKEKMQELEDKLIGLGYRNEDVCEKLEDTTQSVWHIFDMPRVIEFSVLTNEVVDLLKSYGEHFNGRVAVIANKAP